MKKIVLALSTAVAIAGLPSVALAAPAAPAAPAAAAPAADPQTMAAVKSMLEAMDMRTTLRASFAEMEEAMPLMMRSQIASLIETDTTLNAKQKKETMKKMEKAMPGMQRAVSRVFRDPTLVDEIIAEMVPVYARHFTTAEIGELAAFYQTPLGRKMMAALPKISTESMMMSEKVVMPRMGKLVQDVMQELQKP